MNSTAYGLMLIGASSYGDWCKNKYLLACWEFDWESNVGFVNASRVAVDQSLVLVKHQRFLAFVLFATHQVHFTHDQVTLCRGFQIFAELETYERVSEMVTV
jgi:hypothetical protein